jgi:SAM-dependent methyltransferase
MSGYLKIKEHYESCFIKYGDNHKGVDWPNMEDLEKRYKVMLQVMGGNIGTLLDFGCGTAMLVEYIKKVGLENNVIYTGLDISSTFIDYCKLKYPNLDFICLDLMNPDVTISPFDYIILNGVFTEKLNINENDMWHFFSSITKKVFDVATKGIAFNLMSNNVDWKRDDLFHVSLDKVTSFACKNLSRNFVIRNDYGLYEYTMYVYK